MNSHSKLQLPYNCYELGHTWTPFCSHAAAGMGFFCFKEALKIYGSVYLISTLLRGKVPDKEGWKKLLLSIFRSSTFLSYNAFGFLSFFCLCRCVLGGFSAQSSAFLPAFLASYLAVLVEPPGRREMLAIYVTNIASETLFRMLVCRGYIKPIPKGEVFIFMSTLAALMYWFRVTRKSNDALHSLTRFIVGPEETIQYSEGQPTRTQRVPTSIWGRLLAVKHLSCPHDNGCIHYIARGLLRKFLLGVGMHLGLSVAVSIPASIKNPYKLIFAVMQNKHARFGAFLASFNGLFRAASCALRWIRNRDDPRHAIPAGAVSGLSMLFYPNTTIALYSAWKTIEAVYREGIVAGKLPSFPGFAELLYALSTATLFHAAVMEPHNLKPSYWKFLARITDNKIAEMNRNLLDQFGLESTKFVPNFVPKFELQYISQHMKRELQILPAS